jgi:hypothetical protein
MFDRLSGVFFKVVCGAVCLLALSACSGGSGAAPANIPAPTVTQSNITLPSSVQVVSAK